jgi:hypothetical protein
MGPLPFIWKRELFTNFVSYLTGNQSWRQAAKKLLSMIFSLIFHPAKIRSRDGKRGRNEPNNPIKVTRNLTQK